METTPKRRELTRAEKEDAERLKAAWLAYKERNEGANQDWLGRETGIGSQSVIGQYLRGVIPLNLPALLSFCRVLGVEPEQISPGLSWLMPAGNATIGTPVIAVERGATAPEGYVTVPRFNLRVQGGDGHIQWEIDEEPEPHVYSAAFLRSKGIKPENAKRIKVIGDSMEPHLYDGESALIDAGDTTVRDGKVYAIRYGDGFRVKRILKKFDGSLVLVSDNKKYGDEIVSAEQAAQFITILGRVRDRSGSGGLE
ncbi:LexA family transcriptional regulator [Burkholderia gladioli]|uniref:LexA family transcriptional regulator n=1 Tax=Burkholderia gladioli TaxID=28095 RepID=UPI0016403DB6|nr:LexA family transcriptional regulator [Burkholderia gladioli]